MAYSWLKRWLYTTNHKEVGLLYFFTSLYFGFIGAILALLMRVQLSVPNNSFLSAVYYNQAVTMHGIIMIFWFLSPVAIGLANYFVPLQIGAKDLAFPRLNALSYWLYLAGGVMAILSFFVPGGSADAGWTTYQPLATPIYSPGIGPTMVYLGWILLAVSITLGSVNFIVTIFWLRAPGVTLSKIPMFTWFILFTIVQMLFSFPTLIASLMFISADRILGTTFLSSVGIQPSILWDNLFWFFGHPEVYIVLLPAFGVIADVMPAFTGRPLAAKNAILIATALVVLPISFGVWMHHMFVTGIPVSLQAVFSVSTIAISVPFDVITLSFVESLIRGKIRFTTPFLFCLGAIVLFIIGGITGVFLSSPVLDRVFRGSYFVVAHFHYVMVGASIFGLIAGIYYWLPKMSGRMYNEGLGKLHFVVSFIGFNVLYFPMNLLMDMPRRIFTYQNVGDWPLLNGIASVGAFIFAGAQIILAANLLHTWFRGPAAGQNPWGAQTLEWTAPSPAAPAPEGAHSPSEGWIGQLSHAVPHSQGAEPGHADEHGPHLSSRPLTLSLGTLFAFMGFALGTGPPGVALMAFGIIVVAYALVGWARDDLKGRFSMPPDGPGERWPFTSVAKFKLGMWTFLGSEIILFGSFIGAYIYIRAAASSWPAAGTVHSIPIGTANTLILVTSGLTMALALQAIRSGNQRRLLGWLAVTFLLGAAFMGIKVSEWLDLAAGGFVPWSANSVTSLAASAYYFLVGLHGAHVTAGLVMMIYLMKKTMSGMFTKEEHSTLEYFALYWAFVDIVWCFIFPLFYLI
jgi:cytochrome c oxidase subunit I+III